METYRAHKGSGIYYIIASLVLYDGLILILLNLINSYILTSLLKLFLIGCSIYHLYYIMLNTTLRYYIDGENLSIAGIWGLKKAIISLKNIECYMKSIGPIKGVKLSGFGRGNFAIGKFVIHKIGTTSMYATSNKNVVYLKVKENNYAIAPDDIEALEKALQHSSIQPGEWETKWNKESHLYKDKRFIRLLIVVSIIITILTLNPFLLYLMNALPSRMPLNFDANFIPLQFGSGKQFAFSQMIYGVLNMAVLFCMYYASYFYARYDKKSSIKFIYAALFIAIVFLALQFRILYTFR